MSIFRDKVAIVTGAGSGIGRGLAEELARRGAVVVISDVNSERIEEVGKGIEAAGGKADWLTLDVTDHEAVKKMVDDAVAEHGRLDYIFNNAGIAVGGEARGVPREDWIKVLDVNLGGVVNGVTAAYPVMAEQGFGHIVNMASIEGLAPFPVTASYVASKHAVVGLSSALRVEGAGLGVKVSSVCPGYIKTRIYEDAKLINLDREKLLEGIDKVDWLGISSEECAKRILMGVEKNKAIIVVTAFAKILWALHRISPNLVIRMMTRVANRAREERAAQQAAK
jgi:NAD(P)-dependent dehydrogenase (short-subunit alcohol dehydrogenase family)